MGRRYAIKCEYGDPEGRGSNKEEAKIALQFPQMLPWTIMLDNAFIHRSKATVDHARALGFEIVWNLPYHP